MDWDVIAGILAAITALTLHFIGHVPSEAVLAVLVALMALLLLRDLRAESVTTHLTTVVKRLHRQLLDITKNLATVDVVLIPPHAMGVSLEHFSLDAKGEVTWYNISCQMICRQELFDRQIVPLLNNASVTSMQMICIERERELWQREIMPKLEELDVAFKMREPLWVPELQPISFMMADMRSHGQTDILVNFWVEPFMTVAGDASCPRYSFLIQKHNELSTRLKEIVRECWQHHRHVVLPLESSLLANGAEVNFTPSR